VTQAAGKEHRVGTQAADISEADWRDARIIWNYQLMDHELRRCGAAIALGSNDLGVATHAARLYHEGLFPVVVFTGANSPTTIARFPRGEATHYREHALERGVPEQAILVEPTATNTGQNISRSRAVLREAGVRADCVLLISKPYMQRRAYVTCRKAWPEVTAVCAAESVDMADYVRRIGNTRLVIDMLVGDLQRIVEYPEKGFAIAQPVPDGALAAYQRLVQAGFTSRLLPG
jgi:uncharacterized SAM-binding protein YcdF (DUF218 family)